MSERAIHGPAAASALRVTGTLKRGFALERAGAPPLRAIPDGAGWRLEGAAREACRLAPDDEGGHGFAVTLARGGAVEELGRSSRAGPDEEGIAPAYLLLDDGRLFRAAAFEPRAVRVELLGWEVPGAYAVARAVEAGWIVERTPAGTKLEAGDALWVLFAAELLRLDGVPGESEA